MLAFPDDYRTLVPKLLSEVMAAIGQSFLIRINLATGDVVPETKALSKGYLFFCQKSLFGVILEVEIYFLHLIRD